MSLQTLQVFLPERAMPFIQKWFGNHRIHLHISKVRQSKLGHYRKLPDKSHEISINGDLEPHLFFFVLTHELAHLLAFHQHARILAHGSEWKSTFREMLLESLSVYPEDLQILLRQFSKSPKANFMSSADLVKYFDRRKDHEIYVEELEVGNFFRYQNHTFKIEERNKKRYLCKNIITGRKYYFKSCARVEKTNHE